MSNEIQPLTPEDGYINPYGTGLQKYFNHQEKTCTQCDSLRIKIILYPDGWTDPLLFCSQTCLENHVLEKMTQRRGN